MRGRPAPKRPSKPSVSASSRMKRLLRLPLHAEGRVGEQVVEARAGVAVVGEAVAEGDVLEVLALHHQVAAADRIGLGVVLLAVALQARLRVELAQVVLGHREHAAGAAGRVAQGAHDAGLGQRLAVGLEEQVHHQADDLARREVVAGRLVGGLGELAHQLLEDVAHLDVAHHVGVQVDLGELLDHQVEAVGLVELLDLGLEAEVLDDLARPRAEAGDVLLQVGRDVVGVVGELGEVEAAGVVEGLAGGVVEDRLEVLHRAALEAFVSGQHLGLGGLKDAVEATQDGERQDHLAVLGRLVGAAQQVGDDPDEADLVGEAVQLRRLPPAVTAATACSLLMILSVTGHA